MLKINKSKLVEVIKSFNEKNIKGCHEIIFAGNEKEEIEGFLNTLNFVYRPFSECIIDYFAYYKIWCVNEYDVEEYQEEPLFNISKLHDYDIIKVKERIQASYLYLKYLDSIFDNIQNSKFYIKDYSRDELIQYFDNIIYGVFEDSEEEKEIIFENKDIVIMFIREQMNVHNSEDIEYNLYIMEKEEEVKQYSSYTEYKKQLDIKEKFVDMINNDNNKYAPLMNYKVKNHEEEIIKKYMYENYDKLFLDDEVYSIDLNVYDSSQFKEFGEMLKEINTDYISKYSEVLKGNCKPSKDLPEFNLNDDSITLTKKHKYDYSYHNNDCTDCTIYITFSIYKGKKES